MNSDNLTFAKILRNIQKKSFFLIVFLLLMFSGTFAYGAYIGGTTYQGSMRFLVNLGESTSGNQAENLKTNVQLMSTYSEIITSNQMLASVNKKLRLSSDNLKEVGSHLEVMSDSNSLIIQIRYQNAKEKMVSRVMNALSSSLKTEYPRIFPDISISIIEKPDTPVKVSNSFYFILVALVWLSLSFIYIIIETLFDDNIVTELDIEELHITYLGRLSKE